MWWLPALFALIAIVFAGLAVAERRRPGGARPAARRAYSRVAAAFAVVSVALGVILTLGDT